MALPTHRRMDGERRGLEEDLAYQERILQGVSRTFALTIPQLPEDLRAVVGNAYLLCRIADTIEDSEVLSPEEKRDAYDQFVALVAGGGDAVAGDADAEGFAADLAPLLTGSTLEAERDLIRNTPAVLRLTRSFGPCQRAALARCVRIMSEGMERFQDGQFQHGLGNQAHLDAYCYHVAGVVGEMLTELFCAHSTDLAQRESRLSELAVSFGQGLQMTNILKDIWDDKERGVCWLPREVFLRHGFDLSDLSEEEHGAAFQAGLRELVAVARGHLDNALTYTLLIPKTEKGIRAFCLWAIGMAILTLRNIWRQPDFTSGDQVKISRRSVGATIGTTRLLGGSNALLRLAFNSAAWRLPRAIPATRPGDISGE